MRILSRIYRSALAQASDHRGLAKLADGDLVVTELQQDCVGMLPQRGSGKVDAVAATVNAHGAPDCNDLALRRMHERPEGLQMLDLNVVDRVRDVMDRRKRHILRFEQRHPFGARRCRESLRKHMGEIEEVRYSGFPGLEAVVMRELLPPDRSQQALPKFRLRR